MTEKAIFDTEMWATVRLEDGAARTRVYVRGLVNDKPERWVTRHFDVETPDEITEALEKVLDDRKGQLEAAGKMASMEARKVAVNRREIEEVMQ